MKSAAKGVFVLSLVMAAMAPIPAQAQMYWRMDIGWSQPEDAGLKDNDFNRAGNIWGDPNGTTQGILNNVDASPLIGAGVGYGFSNGLRGEVAFAYRPSYRLYDRTFEATYSANIQTTTLMLNAYYDFSAGGVRPYIGAGFGWARNDTDKLVQNFGFGFSNTFDGATKDNAAYALMAGVGIPFSGWTLDIGYRYIDLGEFGTTTSAAFGITSGHTGKLKAHEFTLGARF